MLRTGGQDLLLDDSTRKLRKSRTFRYELSSLDRNFRGEVSNQFRWRFPNPIREVTDIVLVGGTVPEPVANINEGHNQRTDFGYNKFTLLFSGTTYTITIPIGNYTPASLATQLKTLMDLATASAFTVGVSPLDSRLSISHPTTAFSLLFGTGSFVDLIDPQTGAILKMNSPALLLGFAPAVDVASVVVGGVNQIQAGNAMDVYALTNRVYLYLNYETTQDLIAYNRGIGRKEPSAIIYMDEVRNERKFLNKDTYTPLIVAKPAPIARINTLYVNFEDFFGNPINFGNREVSLVLEITILEA